MSTSKSQLHVFMACFAVVLASGSVNAEVPCAKGYEAEESGSTSLPPFNSPLLDEIALRNCLVTAEDVLGAMDSYALVDVRSAHEAARLRIPDALNMHLADVTGSNFIPVDRHIVLIGNGTDAVRLLNLCRDAQVLKRRSLSVLGGGVRAWHHAGGQVIGDIANLSLPWIVSSHAVRELMYLPGTWLVSDALAVLPEDVSQNQLDAKGIAPFELAQRLRLQAGNASVLAIMFIFESRQDMSSWRDAFTSAGLPEPMFHEQDVAAYLQWIEQQRKINSRSGGVSHLGCRWN